LLRVESYKPMWNFVLYEILTYVHICILQREASFHIGLQFSTRSEIYSVPVYGMKLSL